MMNAHRLQPDSPMNAIIEAATAYRADHPDQKGGIVLVFRGEACGWKDRLRNPEGERPGTYAIDDAGRAWEAIGGDDYHGAVTWEVRA